MKRSRCAIGRVQGDVADRDSVLVDTSVWVGFLAGRSEEVAIVTSLRRAHHIVICGQILQEVLQGSRDTSALAKLEWPIHLFVCELDKGNPVLREKLEALPSTQLPLAR